METQTDQPTDIGQEKKDLNLLNTILSIPMIGEVLTFIIAIAPAFIFSLVFYPILFSETESPPEQGFSISTFLFPAFLFVLVVVTWYWLKYLEKKANLVILLPIPIINIPVKWLLYPFMLPIFGIQWIFRHFSTKSQIVSNLETDLREPEK